MIVCIIFIFVTVFSLESNVDKLKQKLTIDRAKANSFLPTVRARRPDDPEEVSEAQTEVTGEGRKRTGYARPIKVGQACNQRDMNELVMQ